jgi:hypothetical protein
MATARHDGGPILPGRGSAVFNHHSQCFETLAGASIPVEWAPPGPRIRLVELLSLLTRIEAREKGGQHGPA